MKKTVLIIVIVLVAASAFLFFKDFFGLGKSQNENGLVPPVADSSGMKQEMSNASEVVVTVNENSEFVPKVVNVKKGQFLAPGEAVRPCGRHQPCIRPIFFIRNLTPFAD